jgi:hypothetical protein
MFDAKVNNTPSPIRIHGVETWENIAITMAMVRSPPQICVFQTMYQTSDQVKIRRRPNRSAT